GKSLRVQGRALLGSRGKAPAESETASQAVGRPAGGWGLGRSPKGTKTADGCKAVWTGAKRRAPKG
ncbi:MAG: hypothetical protein R3Y56_10235, partial [Akkermansia sp.]